MKKIDIYAAILTAFVFVSFITVEPHLQEHGVKINIYEVTEWMQSGNHISEEMKRAAVDVMRETGVPASTTLAQYRLEGVRSNGEHSDLVKLTNNPFNIKCRHHGMSGCYVHRACKENQCLIRDKKFGKCCTSFENDDECDRFKNFDTIEEGIKAHLALLQNARRYRPLFNIAYNMHQRNDDLRYMYLYWAHGLQKLGYATDPNYGQKLCDIIRTEELWRLDLIVLNEQYNILHRKKFVKGSNNSQLAAGNETVLNENLSEYIR